MYEYPVLFPAISNRESFVQTIQIADDQTGDLITLTDNDDNPLYQLYLEISPPRTHGGYSGAYSSPYYDERGCYGTILATLANYLSIPDIGTIQVQIPYTAVQTLRGGLTYDVYLSIVDVANVDARQLLIGKLPIAHGGRNTQPFVSSGGLT
jgi:hypothetical protein